jgi:hypothetical protein
MRKILAILTFSLLGACVASVRSGPGAPPPGPPPPPRHHERERNEPRIIEGTIRDAATRQPIDRASVDITATGTREMTVQTGPDGRYRTQELPRGEFVIRCRREGYDTVIRKAEMSDGIARVDIELTPKRR